MYDSHKIEKKWQDKWEQAKIFDAYPDPNRKKIFMTSPYPYPTGLSHIGNGRSFVNGDIFARYYRAKGFNVLYPMAFHITGTPVLAISSSVERNDQEMMSRMREYVSFHTKDQHEVEKIVDSFREPWEVVNYFSKAMKLDFKAMGIGMDWRREFSTGERIYNKFIEWQYYKLYDKGYLEKGEYPILYCPQDENAVGEDDILGGDEKDLNINQFVCIKFPFEDGYLVASTLRPETIYGVTNIWINPEGRYVKSSINGEKWYFSEDAIFIFENQNKEVKVLESFEGVEIIGKCAKDVYGVKDLLILPGEFVETSTATGVVYSVPAHAPYDYIALLELQKNKNQMKEFNLNQREVELIYPIHIIDLKGFKEISAKVYIEKHGITSQKDTEKLDMATSENYSTEFYAGVLNANCGKYQGMKVSEAAKQVTIDLIEENKADKIYIPVTKNLKCKCGTNIIVSILKDQWFLNFNAGDWKNRAFKCLEKINITPSKYRSTFEYMFNWLEKRPCARKRGLGTNLPFNNDWIIEPLSDSTIYMAFYTISYKLRDYNIEPAQLIPEFFEFVFLEKGDVKSLAKQTYIEEEILKELRTEFLYWYPVDHRHTAIMHISNHLSFFVFHHVAIFPEKHWPKIISLIEPVIVEGQKMGKSKGNVITLGAIRKEYSADVFRFYISHGADFSAYMDFREKEIKAVKANIWKFYEFSSKKIELTKNLAPQVENVKSRYSRVMMSRISKNFINAKTALEQLNIRKYLQISFYETFRLIQDIFKNTEDEQEALQVFKIIYEEWLKILSLVIPHVCEELWEQAGQRGFISTEVWSDVSNKYIDETLETEFEYITNIIEDILNIKKIVRTQSFNNIYLYTAQVWMYKVLEIIDSEEGDFKAIIATLKKDSDIMKNSQVIPFIKAQLKDNTQKRSFPQLDETLLLDQYKTYIEKRVNSAIHINSEFDPNQRALKARPFKPGIFIDT